MINVLKRDLKEKNKEIIARDYIPGNIYASHLEKSIPIEIYKTDFIRLVESGDHKPTINLNLNGDIKKCSLREVQVDPIKGNYIHLDFLLLK